MPARCRVLISILADIFLHRYIEKTCQGHEELSLKIQFRNSNLRELSENDNPPPAWSEQAVFVYATFLPAILPSAQQIAPQVRDKSQVKFRNS